VDLVKSLPALLAAVATALLLSSCTSPASDGRTDHEHGTESSAAAQPAGFNADDVAFATNMIPHHQQAVQMSALVPARSTDPAVIKLAADIAAAQGPEIETMKVFLVQWSDGSGAGGQERSDSGNGGGHGGHDMAMHGMVDAATMKKLESLKGNEFDTLWLESMIGHHRGAVEMANAEIANGASADAKSLARQIVTAQEAEIKQMKQMGVLTHDG
jgi:uncharacterized protein (DUF305 family)